MRSSPAVLESNQPRVLLHLWLSGVFLLLVLFAIPRLAQAQAPQPGDKVKITLHDGNAVVGMLLGLTDMGYRLRFAGTEVIVAYPSVRAIEIVTPEALLEDMRPPDFRQVPRAAPPEESMPEAEPAPVLPPPPMSAPPQQQYSPTPPPPAAPPIRVRPAPQPAPAPRAAPPPYPVRRAPTPPEASATIPPKPRSRGGGLMTTGFILFGIGTGIAVSSAVVYDHRTDYDYEYGDGGKKDHDYLQTLTAAGGIMAASGIVMAVTGIVMKSVSGARRRRWERKYAQDAFSPLENLTVSPSITPEGGGGISVLGRF